MVRWKSLAFVVCIVCQSSSAYELERAIVNQAHELAACAAYFTLMAGCAENTTPNSPLIGQLEAAAVQALMMSHDLSNQQVSMARIEMEMKGLNDEMANHCSNSSILINEYAGICEEAMERPEDRMQYWLNKEPD